MNGVAYDCGISPMSCRVAFVIADHLNSVSGDAWPSVERVAKKLCVSTRTVRRCVGELERAGWLIVTRPRGRTRTNRYRPRLPTRKLAATVKRTNTRSKGDNGVPEKRKQMSPNPT